MDPVADWPSLSLHPDSIKVGWEKSGPAQPAERCSDRYPTLRRCLLQAEPPMEMDPAFAPWVKQSARPVRLPTVAPPRRLPDRTPPAQTEKCAHGGRNSASPTPSTKLS